MRDLTRAEIEEYLDFAWADRSADNFSLDQTRLIGEVVIDHNRLNRAIGTRIIEAFAAGVDPYNVLVSLWVSAFQMGRECESRLLTAALKGAVR